MKLVPFIFILAVQAVALSCSSSEVDGLASKPQSGSTRAAKPEAVVSTTDEIANDQDETVHDGAADVIMRSATNPQEIVTMEPLPLSPPIIGVGCVWLDEDDSICGALAPDVLRLRCGGYLDDKSGLAPVEVEVTGETAAVTITKAPDATACIAWRPQDAFPQDLAVTIELPEGGMKSGKPIDAMPGLDRTSPEAARQAIAAANPGAAPRIIKVSDMSGTADSSGAVAKDTLGPCSAHAGLRLDRDAYESNAAVSVTLVGLALASDGFVTFSELHSSDDTYASFGTPTGPSVAFYAPATKTSKSYEVRAIKRNAKPYQVLARCVVEVKGATTVPPVVATSSTSSSEPLTTPRAVLAVNGTHYEATYAFNTTRIEKLPFVKGTYFGLTVTVPAEDWDALNLTNHFTCRLEINQVVHQFWDKTYENVILEDPAMFCAICVRNSNNQYSAVCVDMR